MTRMPKGSGVQIVVVSLESGLAFIYICRCSQDSIVKRHIKENER